MHKAWLVQRTAVAAAALCMTLALTLGAPAAAHAASLEDVQAKLAAANTALAEANERVNEVESAIADNEAKLDELEAKLPEAEAAAAAAVKSMYKMQTGSAGLLELVLSSDDFNQFLQLLQYLGVMTNHHADAVNQLIDMEQELQQTKANLAAQLKTAQQERDSAQAAKEEAEAAQQAVLDALKAQAEAEAAERAAAEAAAAQAASAGQSATTSGGQGFEVVAPGTAPQDPGPAPATTDKETFINTWGAKIDAVLAGRPLGGYGKVFAEAAYELGVDPTFSAAISIVESSGGLYCFLPYNAWGWGSVRWSNWNEAIWSHTRGLANLYGGYLTYAGAKMYCPPNTDFWYTTVRSYMLRMGSTWA